MESVRWADVDKNAFSILRGKSVSVEAWLAFARKVEALKDKQVSLSIDPGGGYTIRGGVPILDCPPARIRFIHLGAKFQFPEG